MTSSKTSSIIHCIAIAAASILTSTATLAASPGFSVKKMLYSTVQCTAKNPSHQQFLQPGARGLFNASTKLAVPVLCTIPKPMRGTSCVAGEVNFYGVSFHINPSVSRGRAAQLHVFSTNIEWGKLDPQGNNPKAGSGTLDDGTPGPGSVVIARRASTGNPLDDWNGTDKYISLGANVRMPCDQGMPTIRITIPPRAFATAITDTEIRVSD